VLQGKAGRALLDSFDTERAPVGKQIVLRANKSIEEFGAILEALGVQDTQDVGEMQRRIASRADETAEGAARPRAAAHGARAQGLRIQRARRRARPAVPRRERWCRTGRPSPRTPVTRSCSTTRPPGRAPACRTAGWPRRPQVSTHDVVGKGRFAVLTGLTGRAWARAASKAAAQLGIELTAVVIGPFRRRHDLYDDWARLREVAEDGCVLVPARRARRLAVRDDGRRPEAELVRVLSLILTADPRSAVRGDSSAGSTGRPGRPGRSSRSGHAAGGAVALERDQPRRPVRASTKIGRAGVVEAPAGRRLGR